MKTIELLTQRRTSRRYERRGIEPEKMQAIFEAIRNTPTSYNGQQFSVIAVTDQQAKVRISEITSQKQIKTCAVFLLFCIDFNKLRIAGAAKGIDIPPFSSTIDGYTVGVIDASLAMMSAVVAAESLGLGSCCIGYARTCAPRELSDMVCLPPGTSIVCGLAVGYPAERPDLKPKLPMEAVIHENRYRPQDELLPCLEEYDRYISEYNRSRTGSQTDNDWVGHILDYHREGLEKGIEFYLERQVGLKVR